MNEIALPVENAQMCGAARAVVLLFCSSRRRGVGGCFDAPMTHTRRLLVLDLWRTEVYPMGVQEISKEVLQAEGQEDLPRARGDSLIDDSHQTR